MTRTRVLSLLAAAAIIAGLGLAVTSPVDALQGEYSRIIHIHVPSAWLAFLAFGVTAAGSALWLITKRRTYDSLAASSAEIGVLFTAVALLTGMIWGRPVWGRFWDWGDARMSTTAVMFFVYLGYIALRRTSDDPEARARRSAILGLVAVVQVPLVYFSVYLFRTLHQTATIRPDGPAMPPGMLLAMLANLAAFTLLYAALVSARMDVETAETAMQRSTRLAGEAVATPRLGELGDV